MSSQRFRVNEEVEDRELIPCLYLPLIPLKVSRRDFMNRLLSRYHFVNKSRTEADNYSKERPG